MTFRQTLSLTGAVAAFVLSFVTLAQVPTTVQAVDCTPEGNNFGMTCRDQWGIGVYCQYCVADACYNFRPEDAECQETCNNAGSYICFYGS